MLGSWDLESSIPLDIFGQWSQQAATYAECEFFLFKVLLKTDEISVLFRFILKTNIGEILWQPGHHRTFKFIEIENMIAVCDYQELATENGAPSLQKSLAIVAQNRS